MKSGLLGMNEAQTKRKPGKFLTIRVDRDKL